jgi:hypothetical protein
LYWQGNYNDELGVLLFVIAYKVAAKKSAKQRAEEPKAGLAHVLKV